MAKPTRRSILRAGVVAAGMSVPLGTATRALSVVAGAAAGLRRSTFQPHVGSAFTLEDADGSYRAVLTDLSDLKTARRGHDRKFSLLFTVTGARPAGGTYRLSHAKIPAMNLFVTPVGSAGDLYEAVVNAS